MKKNAATIAHISDLHFEDTSHWNLQFAKLTTSLSNQQPDIIVNTGDLLDNPAADAYLKLSRKLNDLCSSIEKKSGKKVYLISVPGNHDYFGFGWLPVKYNHYNDYSGLLQYPVGSKIETIISEFYEKTRIAFFPFDSNEIDAAKDLLGFAQGKITDPEGIYSKFNKCFPDLDKSLLRIALLHHHPLPMAIPAKEEFKEPFLLLRHSHAFLVGSLLNKIDLILHGHMHQIGACDFRTFLPTASSKNLRVFGCGSSGKVRIPTNQYAIHEVDETGYVHSHIFHSDVSTAGYVKAKSLDLLPYEEVRKIRNSDPDLYNSSSMVKEARLMRIPQQVGRRFRWKSATHSDPSRPPIPIDSGHPLSTSTPLL